MFAFKIIIVRLNWGRRSRILSLIFHIRSPKYYGKVFCENAHNQIVFRKGSKCVLYDHVGLQKAKFLITSRPNLLWTIGRFFWIHNLHSAIFLLYSEFTFEDISARFQCCTWPLHCEKCCSLISLPVVLKIAFLFRSLNWAGNRNLCRFRSLVFSKNKLRFEWADNFSTEWLSYTRHNMLLGRYQIDC